MSSNNNEEVSASIGLTETGASVSIKSRAVAAWDRLWGSKVDKKRIPIDNENAELEAVSAARVKFIAAVSELGINRLKSDPDFANRAIDNFLPSIMRKQENIDKVLEYGGEDLRQNPTSTDEDATDDGLSETFLNRFERYAEEATEEYIREKWGKVLASEIRKPGTFSPKVLRVVDELDPATAAIFQRVVQHQIHNIVPISLLGELSFQDVATLDDAGLLVEPGLGNYVSAVLSADNAGNQMLLWVFGQNAIAATKTNEEFKDVDNVIMSIDGAPSLPVYVLTDVGMAIASILPDNSVKSLEELAERLSNAVPESEIRKYHHKKGGEWVLTSRIPSKQMAKQAPSI